MSKEINVNLLYCWGNQAIDDLEKDYIRKLIIKQYVKVSKCVSDEEFLIPFVKVYNWFLDSSNFKKEVMADLIIIYMTLTDCIIDLSDDICRDIVDNASIETIGFYGDMIGHCNLRMLCINKFWDYAFEFYDFTSRDKDISKCLKRKVINEYGKDDKQC